MIQIKDWNRYQSYKDRKPLWIRLHKDLLDNFDFQMMSAEARALLPMLWLLASEDTDPTSGVIRKSEREIAFRLRMDLKALGKALSELQEFGFVQPFADKGCNGSVTEPSQRTTDSVTTETETETEEHTDRTRFDQRVGFEEAWKIYPRREGKKQAWHHYRATVKTEEDHARCLTSIGNYKQLVDYENANRRGDPRPWMHGKTFFNNWQDYEEIDLGSCVSARNFNSANGGLVV